MRTGKFETWSDKHDVAQVLPQVHQGRCVLRGGAVQLPADLCTVRLFTKVDGHYEASRVLQQGELIRRRDDNLGKLAK